MEHTSRNNHDKLLRTEHDARALGDDKTMKTTDAVDLAIEHGTETSAMDASPAPMEAAASFLRRHAPRDRSRSAVRVLELGCSMAKGGWYSAFDGFDTTGVDCSQVAVERARECLRAAGVVADLRVVDFTQLPFADGSFDVVIDRSALGSLGREATGRAFAELARVLKPTGRLFFNPYSDRHTGARSDRTGQDDLSLHVNTSSPTGSWQRGFWNARQVTAALIADWRVLSRQHVEFEEQLSPARQTHAEWRVIAEKVA